MVNHGHGGIHMSKSLTRRSFAAGIASAGSLVLASRSSAQTPDAAGTEGGDDVRVVNAVNGDIELTGTPQRVIAMEYELVEHMQSVGVVPVGATERDSINVWVPLNEPLSEEDVADVGLRAEPDLEAFISLEPDLILAASPRQDAVIDQLEGIATTVQLETYSPRSTPSGSDTSLDHAKGVLRNVALALNKVDEAEAAITDFDTHLTDAAAKVAELGYEGHPFVYGSIILSDTGTVNVFTDLSRIAATLTGLGMTNAISLDENPGSHFVAMSLEQIGTLPDDILFFYSLSAPAMEAINETLDSPVWQSAGFVQNGGVVDLGEPNIWTAGGLITLSGVTDRVVSALEAR